MTGIWVATYLLWILPEIILGRWLRSEKDAQKVDQGSKTIVIAAINLGIFLAFMAADTTPKLSTGDHWKTVFAIGIVVWLSGIILRMYSIRVLGHFFTYDVAISTGQRVVEQGPYRWLRHPSYLGGLLAMIGFGMTLTNWLAMFVPACFAIAGYAYRITVEEQALVRGLGPAYSEYMRRTWRLIPYVF
jgi:protein-S-isoprenylcysteine O-methyltransferase Ste14